MFKWWYRFRLWRLESTLEIARQAYVCAVLNQEEDRLVREFREYKDELEAEKQFLETKI